MYRQDHVKVLKVLGGEVPKRPTFKVSEIVAAGFRRVENADRRVRNAMRKLRSDELVEIAERGEYRLKPSGVAFVQKAAKEGWPTGKEVKKAAKKAPVKKAKKAPAKAAKKVTKTKKKAPAKKATKAKTKKAPVKKASAKKAAKKTPKTAKAPAEKKLPHKNETKGDGNGVSAGNSGSNKKGSGAASQLSW